VVSARPAIDFRGAVNPLLAGLIPLSALFAAWYARRTRNRLALWAVAWGAANYLPYVALAILTQRIMYIYYLLPAIPAIAAAIALLLTRAGLPRFVLWGFVVAYAVGFAAYFPFRQIP
jgi:dolichyl-phosphate-mannose-protein mannosyltransferase